MLGTLDKIVLQKECPQLVTKRHACKYKQKTEDA